MISEDPAAADVRLFDLTAETRVLKHRGLPSPAIAIVPESASASFRPSRRTFLKVGVAAGVALALVRWLREPTASPASLGRFALPPATRAIFAAIIPVMLDGALPSGTEASAARSETLQAIEAAIAGLPPASREELAELFSLLDFAPTRSLV